MIETVLAVLIISSLFLMLFKLSFLFIGKIMTEHAAMRVARARSVGFNDFMCRKAARVAVIPVAGERVWPKGEDAIDWSEELARIGLYMQSSDEPEARGVLEYDRWSALHVDPGDGTSSRVDLKLGLFDNTVKLNVSGKAGVEDNHSLYMLDQGR